MNLVSATVESIRFFLNVLFVDKWDYIKRWLWIYIVAKSFNLVIFPEAFLWCLIPAMILFIVIVKSYMLDKE